jgi:putative serine protease PepD
VRAAVAVAALALAGCSDGGDERAAGTTVTTTATRTVTESVATAEAPAPDTSGSLADAVARVLPSVVSIRTKTFGGGEGEASGVILDHDGLILTNNHVVEGSTSVSVAFNDESHPKPVAATVIGTAPERDLAVIRVQVTGLVPVRLARSSALRLGDAVIAIGFPLGLGGPTVTSGIVSGLDRTIEGENGTLTGLLQTDAAINPGNSGGPLVDRAGRLVGINTAGVREGNAENIGFAISIDEALPVIDRIRRQTPSSQAWLGIAFSSVDSESAAVRLGLDSSTRGAAVTVVYPGGPGEKAELAVGDVITVADDVPIDSAADLARLLATRKPGDAIDLELIDSRGPRLVTVEVVRRAPGSSP